MGSLGACEKRSLVKSTPLASLSSMVVEFIRVLLCLCCVCCASVLTDDLVVFDLSLSLNERTFSSNI